MRALLLASLVLAACVEEVQHGALVQVLVSGTDCGGADVTTGATHWRLRVLSNGALWEEHTGASLQAVPKAVPVPDGVTAALRLEVFEGEPAAGRLIAWGQSRALVPEERTDVVVAIQLAPAEQFVDTCTRLLRARAGHTATLLGNGRVLVAAGHTGGSAPVALGSLELVDPTTRTAEPEGSVSLVVQGTSYAFTMADHAAAAINSGQVLLWGGWRDTQGVRVPTTLVAIWDTDLKQLGAYPVPLESFPRYGHVLLRQGSDLFALGGLTRGAALEPVPQVERIDVERGSRTVAGTLDPALDGAAIGQLGAKAVVAGGALPDGGVSDALSLVRLGPTVATTWAGALATPRAHAIAMPLGDGVLVAGGVDGQGTALGSTEWIRDGAPPQRSTGPAIEPREKPCAAALWDGRVVLVGGTKAGVPSSAAEVLSADGQVRPVGFPGAPRHGHTCTTLGDGSVLVLGGLTSGDEVLGDAWRYVPAPPPPTP